MANETTTTTLTELVNSEYIEQLVLDYAHDMPVASPFCRVSELEGRGTLVASFSVWVKDTAASKTEGTAMSNTALETTDVQATAGVYGILRELTDLAGMTSVLGQERLEQEIARDAAILIMEQLETLVTAEFANASTSVGSTGVDMTVANFVSAINQLNQNLAKGQKVCVLHPVQSADLLTSLTGLSTSIWSNNGVDSGLLNGQNGADGFAGSLLGIPIYYSSTCTTANMSADRVGAMFINGSNETGNPRNAAIGIASLYATRVKQVPTADNLSEQMAFSACFGAVEISDFNITQIVTDA